MVMRDAVLLVKRRYDWVQGARGSHTMNVLTPSVWIASWAETMRVWQGPIVAWCVVAFSL